MMSKNSIVPFLKDYLIKFLTRPFLLDTNDFQIKNLHVLLYMINECITFAQRMQICAYIHI